MVLLSNFTVKHGVFSMYAWFCIFLLAFLPLVDAEASLEVVGNDSSVAVFAGVPQEVKIQLRNSSPKEISAELQSRIFQESSSTAMPVGESVPWKKLTVLPGQTVIETFPVQFPEVKTGTRFQVRLTDGQKAELGRVDVLVFPPGLLKQLSILAGDKPLGILDPSDLLKPLLQASKVEFADLGTGGGIEGYNGPLILAILPTKELSTTERGRRLQTMVGRGIPLVWVHALPTHLARGTSLVAVMRGEKAVTVHVSPPAVADMAKLPLSQLNLIGFAEIALHPEKLQPSP